MDVAALVAELFFASKVEAALGRLGCRPRVLTEPEAGALKDAPPDLLVLDLDVSGPAREAALAAMRAAGRPVIAVGSHTDADKLRWAREAGCAEVLTRGEVARALAALAAVHLARRS